MGEQLVISGVDMPVHTELSVYDQFWTFMYDRQMVWYKRFKISQPAPWTDDPILRQYKFTNVYRELDRGTIYLLDNIIGSEDVQGPAIDQVFNTIMYRMFNRIETWEAIKKYQIPWKRGNMHKHLRALADHGRAIYTDAHMVCAYEGFPGDNKLDRIMWAFDQMAPEMPDIFNMIITSKSLGPIHKRLTEFKGLGPFLAYEIAVDISYAPWNNLSEDEWVNPGPGCQRGLRKIFPDMALKDCAWMIKVLRQAQTKEFARLGLPFMEIAYKGRELTLRNIEHCLCEFFKYAKALDGSGRPRNTFRPIAMIGQEDHERLKG